MSNDLAQKNIDNWKENRRKGINEYLPIPLSVMKKLLSEAKQALKEKGWDGLKEVYDKYQLTEKYHNPQYSYIPSPIYNQITGHLQTERIRKMEIGEKDSAYFSKGKVATWNGKKLGKVINTSYYESGGFAPSKRVSITFVYHGMTFRGICSYENMECFNFKRIK